MRRPGPSSTSGSAFYDHPLLPSPTPWIENPKWIDPLAPPSSSSCAEEGFLGGLIIASCVDEAPAGQLSADQVSKLALAGSQAIGGMSSLHRFDWLLWQIPAMQDTFRFGAYHYATNEILMAFLLYMASYLFLIVSAGG